MLIKFLIIVAIIIGVYIFFVKKKPLNKSTKDKGQLSSNDMVECSSCGIYCEVTDAILSNGKYYCSKECQKRG